MNYFAHVANALSLMRIFLTPVFIWLLLQETLTSITLAVIVFTIAAISDSCDGYFARKFNIVSDLGSFLDPMADKILTIGAYGAFWSLGMVPLWFIILLVSRDIIVTKLRTLLLQQGTPLQTSSLAKWKTFLQFLVLYVLFFYVVVHYDEQASKALLVYVGYFAKILIYGIALLTAYTGFDYLYKARKFLWHWVMGRYHIRSVPSAIKVPFAIDVIASWGYVGYVPYVSGTVASFVTVVLFYFLPEVSRFCLLLAAVILFGIGWWSSACYERYSGVKDSSKIVIDEVVGMMIPLLFIPKTMWWYGLAFILFRFFDISKAYPISLVEEKVSGGLGVMLDDVAAGLYAGVIVCLLQVITK